MCVCVWGGVWIFANVFWQPQSVGESAHRLKMTLTKALAAGRSTSGERQDFAHIFQGRLCVHFLGVGCKSRRIGRGGPKSWGLFQSSKPRARRHKLTAYIGPASFQSKAFRMPAKLIIKAGQESKVLNSRQVGFDEARWVQLGSLVGPAEHASEPMKPI